MNKQSLYSLLTPALLQFHASIYLNGKTCSRSSRRFFFQKGKRGFQFFNMQQLKNILKKYVFRERPFWNKAFFKLWHKFLNMELHLPEAATGDIL